MKDATPFTKRLTLAWSIGLGLLLLAFSAALLLPATKSARVSFERTPREIVVEESSHVDVGNDSETVPAKVESTPPR